MAAVGLALVVLTAGPTSGVYGQEPPIYGSQLMTEQERQEYRARMRAATTAQEREQIRLEHHTQMQARAREQGVDLPEEPPMTDMRRGMGPDQGMGPGQGMGQGQGGMMRQGAPGGRRN